VLPKVIPKRGFGGYRLKDEAGKDLPDPLAKLAWSGNDQQIAELVANALNHLRNIAGAQGGALRDFPQAAAAWRALATKPPIAEAVRAQRLLAETAFNERKLVQALYHYERGVELDPAWPEGRFNAALVAAELEYYGEAVEQMRAYLELAPNAPDAQDAHDNIAIWQDKAAQQAVKSSDVQPRRQNGWPGFSNRRETVRKLLNEAKRKNRMSRFIRIAGQIMVLSLAAAATAVLAQEIATPAMSVCLARRTVVTELQRVQTTYHPSLKSAPSSIVFTVGELRFQAEPTTYKNLLPPGDYTVDLKTLGEVTVVIDGALYGPRVGGTDPRYGNSRIRSERDVSENLSTAILGFLTWTAESENSTRDAQSFANAINALRVYARTFVPTRDLPPPCFTGKDDQGRIWTEFQKRAAAWRVLTAKPPISDDVKQRRLLAEDAYQQKQFDTAAAEYEAGLEIDPLWVQGHFNAAVIYGELKDYDDAVWHMRCYLELMPNAPDAQAARDQMLLWQAKLEQQAAAPAAQQEQPTPQEAMHHTHSH